MWAKIVANCIFILISTFQVSQHATHASSNVMQPETETLCPSHCWNLVALGFGLGMSMGSILDLIVFVRLYFLVRRQELTKKILSLQVKLRLPPPKYSRPDN